VVLWLLAAVLATGGAANTNSAYGRCGAGDVSSDMLQADIAFELGVSKVEKEGTFRGAVERREARVRRSRATAISSSVGLADEEGLAWVGCSGAKGQ
jgi:hypothetical protein